MQCHATAGDRPSLMYKLPVAPCRSIRSSAGQFGHEQPRAEVRAKQLLSCPAQLCAVSYRLSQSICLTYPVHWVPIINRTQDGTNIALFKCVLMADIGL